MSLTEQSAHLGEGLHGRPHRVLRGVTDPDAQHPSSLSWKNSSEGDEYPRFQQHRDSIEMCASLPTGSASAN